MNYGQDVRLHFTQSWSSAAAASMYVRTFISGRLLEADPHTTTDENDPPEDAEVYRDTEPVEEDDDAA